ncbi:hypothetical protein DFJ58DRAFT_510544 [Suillus subalutaceus]|uniref:uncharacterized protein n=1 Tax=Suillus subalutaceus TaxID=48586 RepID=UPI001B86077D|nr:uncharacterized protein DFJ58DRAFT_510544 [Suillus subalutaceus]KAG1845320.1 hypothetical protein DFJ58DRAFT_510544 [Suillus subalutaceus]
MSDFHHWSNNGVPNSSASGPGQHSLDEMFQCMWDCPYPLHCNALIRGYNLSAHLREAHGIHGSDKTRLLCQWKTCNREFNKESLSRHVEEVHMGIVYRCEWCGTPFSRKDTLNKHKKTPH